MTRVAVICGTGMSELTNDFRKKPDSNVSELRIQSKWGEVPIFVICLLYTSQSPRDLSTSRMPSSA